jgi:putative ABC transport system substrate-binding protein
LIARGVADVAGIAPVIAMAGAAANGGLIVFPDFFTSANNELIIAAAAQNRVPAIYPYRYFAANGGLMSYGVNTAEEFRRAAGYVNASCGARSQVSFQCRHQTSLNWSSTLRLPRRSV